MKVPKGEEAMLFRVLRHLALLMLLTPSALAAPKPIAFPTICDAVGDGNLNTPYIDYYAEHGQTSARSSVPLAPATQFARSWTISNPRWTG